MIATRVDLEDVRKKAEAELDHYACRIMVCSGTGCIATGSEVIYETFKKLAESFDGVSVGFAEHAGGSHIGMARTGCQGICELGPLVRIIHGDDVVQYVKVTPDDCQEIFQHTVLRGETIDRLLYRQKGMA